MSTLKPAAAAVAALLAGATANVAGQPGAGTALTIYSSAAPGTLSADALQGLPPEGTKAALAEIIEKLQARGLPVLLAGMEAPRNMGTEYVEQFRAVYADLAAQYDVILYPFFLEGAALNDGMMLGDGIHPNGRGVAAIVESIMPKVEELLAKVEAPDG